MKTRVVSALIMLPLLLLVYFGGMLLFFACIAASLICVREFFSGFEGLDIRPSYPIACASVAGLYAVNFFTRDGGMYHTAMMLWAFCSVLVCLLYLFRINERKLEDGLATMAGIFYIVFFIYHVLLVEQSGAYSDFKWLIFISAFGSDTLAFLTGTLIGKHKLCPDISPKKTVEGAIGGIVGAAAFSALFAHFVVPQFVINSMIIGAFGAAFSQLGDLTASVFKRKMGIKDYGDLIPGHGGLLDRFDSAMFTAPLVYYYIACFLL